MDAVPLPIAPLQDQRSTQLQPLMGRAEEKIGDSVISLGKSEASLHPQETTMQRAAFQPGHKDPPAPSPPRAIASLSVRVLGQPDRQGLPPVTPRTQEKEGTAPSEPGSVHSVLHLSRSAVALSAGGHAKEDSDEDDSVNESDDEEEEEDSGPGPAGPRRDNKAHPQPKVPPGVPSTFARSKRKLQPPQHIPPPQPQPHHSPMQLRHPTPPPSPPSGLFPLPDTPKQSPPDAGHSEDEAPNRMAPFPPPAMQGQDSNSSSRSSSPEPPVKRRPGPLSLLVHKMESERASRQSETPSATDSSKEKDRSSKSLQDDQGPAAKTPLVDEIKKEREPEKKEQEEEKEREKKQEKVKLLKKEEQERNFKEERKEGQVQKGKKFTPDEMPSKDKEASESQETDSSSDSDSKSDSSSHSSQTSSSSGNKTNAARHLRVSVHTHRGHNNATAL